MTRPARCAAHPARPAAGACPTCGRPRCSADATGPTCAVCGRGQESSRCRPAGDLERLVRAALAAEAVALVLGRVTSEYVGAPWLQYVLPVVLGALCGEAATVAARTSRLPSSASGIGRWVRLIAGAMAVLGVAYSVLDEGTHRPLSANSEVLLPYLLAAAGAWLWTLPPRSRRAPG